VYLVAEGLTRLQVGGAALIVIAMIASQVLLRMRRYAGSAI
jgi:hypothetical protein